MNKKSLLKLSEITKVYDNGVVANKKINVDFIEGEIHAIVGENGAGKSTLMKMIFGLEKPSKGTIYLNGAEVEFHSPLDAIDAGIGMVHQHFMLVPSFSVLENILLGNEPSKFGFLQFKDSKKQVQEVAEKYNFLFDLDATVESLGVGIKQKVEILKVLYRGAKVLILDEPTAVLTPQETEQLFVELKRFKEIGHTILFISHKLSEVKQISDRITVMRKGELVSTHNTCDISIEDISELMVGRKVEYEYGNLKDTTGDMEPCLVVENVNLRKGEKFILKDVSLTVHHKEILGIIAVEGNGQNELVDVLFGNRKPNSGSVAVDGMDIVGKTIKEIRKHHISYIPEDRMSQGIAGEGTIAENLISSFFEVENLNNKFSMNNKAIDQLSSDLIEEFDIVCEDNKTIVNSLSGGNIQKVVVARECCANPSFLIAEQPTRGVDIGSANFIHEKLIKLRNQNKSILLLSADLSETLAVSDKIIVMYSGEIVAYFNHSDNVSEKELGLYMLGLKKQKKAEIGRIMYE